MAGRGEGAGAPPRERGGGVLWPGSARRNRAGQLITDAVQWIEGQFEDWLRRGGDGGAASLSWGSSTPPGADPRFPASPPSPATATTAANWLISPGGVGAGVIDFEFAYWDVRAADFTRYPEWSWIERPGRSRLSLTAMGALSPPPKSSSGWFPWPIRPRRAGVGRGERIPRLRRRGEKGDEDVIYLNATPGPQGARPTVIYGLIIESPCSYANCHSRRHSSFLISW